MSQLTGIPVGASGFIEPKRERISGFWILLALFILGAATVSPVKGWSVIVHGMGFVLAFAYLIETLRGRLHVAPEMFLYLGWITWCLAGSFEHPSAFYYMLIFTTAFQIFVLAVIVAGFTDNRRVMSLNMLAFLLAVVILGTYSYATGEYRMAESETIRLSGLAVNANNFGWIMLLAFVALAYLWMLPTRRKWLKYGVCLVAFTAAGVSELLSFSRTHIVGMAFFVVVWLWLCYRKVLRRSLVTVLLLAGVLILLTIVGYMLFEQRGGQSRLDEVRDVLTGRLTSGSVYIRLMNFKYGWDMLWEHPLTGGGLQSFLFRAPLIHIQAHNEFVEIASGTGLPGFFLYFGILWVLWRRGGKLVKYADTPFTAQVGGLTRALVLTVLVTDLGRWNYSDKPAWIILGSFIGFTYASWRSLRQRAAPQPTEAGASGVPASRLVTGPMGGRPGLSEPR